ncbi:hypothetical protein QQ045_009073 [Rhodiola kirilowii]
MHRTTLCGAVRESQVVLFSQAGRVGLKQDIRLVQVFSIHGGRATLISSILGSIPIHTLSILPVPKGCIKRIESLLSKFLWDSRQNSRRHWVNWPKVCYPKPEGGLGIKPLLDVKNAVLSTLAWRFMFNSSLWAAYARNRFKNRPKGSAIWTAIFPLIQQLGSESCWTIGKGNTRVSHFCEWLDIPAPADVCDRPMRDIVSNQELAAGLMELITVKNVLLARRTAGPHKVIFKNIWQTWIPPKISVFIWEFFHKVTPTDDDVISLGIPIASKCVCCESPQVESTDHMFLSSNVAASLWRFLASVFWGKCASFSTKVFRNNVIHGSNTSYNLLLPKIRHWAALLSPQISGAYFHPSLENQIAILALHVTCPNLKIRRGVSLKWLPHPSGFTMNVASHYGRWDSFDRWRSARAQLGPTPVFEIHPEVNLAARILAYHKGQHLCTFNAFSELPRAVQRAIVGDLQNLPVFCSST